MKTITTYLYLAALAFVLFISAVPAHAETTALIGESHFAPQSDGTWYQDAFPHDLKMSSPSVGLRYDTAPSDAGWSFGGGYEYLGRVSSSAVAVALDGRTPNDGGYNSATKSCNGTCWPVSHWYGHGDVQGFFGLASKHYGQWSVESGLYLYRPTWSIHIPDWIECRTCAPQNIMASHAAHWQVGPMFGLRYKLNDWSLNLSTWHTQTEGDSWPALYHSATYNFSLGHSF